MIVPNKFVSLDDSGLGHIGVILDEGPDPIGLEELYKKVERKFDGVDQFLIALDILFLLNKIEVNFESRTVMYVD